MDLFLTTSGLVGTILNSKVMFVAVDFPIPPSNPEQVNIFNVWELFVLFNYVVSLTLF